MFSLKIGITLTVFTGNITRDCFLSASVYTTFFRSNPFKNKWGMRLNQHVKFPNKWIQSINVTDFIQQSKFR